MVRTGVTALMIAAAVCCITLSAQSPSAQESRDLKIELRSATGSNRFQLGEVVPIEVLVSSSTLNRYLEPCKMFWEGCFGYPQCRFETRWALDVTPATGWTDIGWHGCGAMGGPTFEVKSSDLTMEPKKYAYTLTTRFRFDTPGKYTVRLSLAVGLDNETNQFRTQDNAAMKHDSVSKTAEMVLEIVPAGDAWKKTVLEQGLAAWSAKPPADTKPSSPEFVKYQQETDALCNLGTTEAAVAFAQLLSQGVDVRHCLEINSNREAAKTEMRRLLVDPNTGIRAIYFAEYAWLLSGGGKMTAGAPTGVPPKVMTDVRDTLFASLPKKTPDAMIRSLETVLRNPMSGYWVLTGSVYDLREPYSPEVIAMAVANYDRLSPGSQAALLDREWDHVRSPAMLPVVRRKAENGDGQALLRWQELEPAAATAFMRTELIQPAPRFSALYIRLPEESLPVEEWQMTTNLVALSHPRELIAEATLLHRYATSTTLPTVLPFIDQHLSEWPCEVQIPVLAYLLKVSPGDARPRVEQVLKTVRPPYCPRGEFFSSLGFMQASSVLEVLAARQVEDGTPLSEDAASYLRRYGSAAMKPVVWAQFSRWHKKYVASGAEPRIRNGKGIQEDYPLYTLDMRLREAYVNAHGWILSPEEVSLFLALQGGKETQLACTFSCGSKLSVGPAPGEYYIYGRVNDPVYEPESRIDYLLPTEPYQYQINQYGCRDLKDLEQKILQFPAGSKFSFANTRSGQDVGDWTAISAFLRTHGYQAGN